MDIRRSSRYGNSGVKVTLDISDGNDGREDLTIQYPIQEDKHLTMLMEPVKGEDGKVRSIDHLERKELSDVIKDAIPKED
jgi:hypothetical protein